METKRNYTNPVNETNFLIRYLLVMVLPMVVFSMAFSKSPENAYMLIPPQVEIVEIGDLICPDFNDGFLHLAVTAGNPPYSIEWDFDGDADPSEIFNPPENDTLMFYFIGDGTLTVTISDTLGNEATFEYDFFNTSESPEVSVNPSISDCNNGQITLEYDTNLISDVSGGLSDADGPVAPYPFSDALLPPGEYSIFYEYTYDADPDMGSIQESVNCSNEVVDTVPQFSVGLIIMGPGLEIKGCTGGATAGVNKPIDILGWSWGATVRNPAGDTLTSRSGPIDSIEFDIQLDSLLGCSKEEAEEVIIDIYDSDSYCDTSIVIILDPIDTLKVVIDSAESGQGVISGEISGDSALVDVLLEKYDSTTGEYVVVDSIIGLEPDSNGMAKVVFEDLPEGEYRLRITDECGCSKVSEPIEIDGPPDPIFAEVEGIAPTDSSQSDGQLKISVTDGANDTFDIVVVEIDSITGDTLQIDTLTGMVADSIGCIIVDDLNPGIYIVGMSDPTGQLAPFDSGPISIPPWECEMTITFGSSVVPIACAGDSTLITAIVLDGLPPYVYSFSTGDVQGPTSNSNTVTPVPAGTHSVTITDVQPCERVDTITITEPDPITLEVICSESSICQGDTVSISASAMGGTGNLTFEWDNGETGENIEVTSSGEYCVTVTDENGCEHTACCEVEKCPQIEAEASGIAPTDSTNSDGQIKITVHEGESDTFDVVVIGIDSLTGDTISIDTLMGVVADSMGCIVIDSLDPGTYGLEVSDPSGERDPWEGGTEVFPHIPCDISIEIDCPSKLFCPDDDILLNLEATVGGGSGHYSIEWSTGESSYEIEIDEEGEYCVTVSDDIIDDCEDEACCEPDIEVCPEIMSSIENDTICHGDSDGELTVMASGGCGSLSYMWSNGEDTPTIDSLGAGVYIVTITDEEDCEIIDTSEVVACPEIELIQILCDTICPDSTNGTAMVLAEGGCEPLSYHWSDGVADGPSVNSLSAGWVYVTVTDAYDCELIDSCEIIGQDVIPPVAVCNDVTIYVDENGEASIDPEDVDGGSEDNCELDFVSVSRSEFDCDDINGSVSVILTAVDAAGLEDSCIAEVTVLDTISPPINCPESVVIYMPETTCVADVFYDPPATSDSLDNCGEPIVITYSPNIGSELSVGAGTYPATAFAFDSKGNSSSCNFNIELQDTVPPKILGCPEDYYTVYLSDWLVSPALDTQCYLVGPHVHGITSNCAFFVFYEPGLGEPLEANGVFNVEVLAIDNSNNQTICQYDLYIIDDVNPSMSCPQEITAYTPQDTCYAWVNIQGLASDNCGIDLVSNSYTAGGEDASGYYGLGSTIVSFTAEDVNENTDDCQTNVIVLDTFPPVVNCPSDTIVYIPHGESEVFIQLDNAEAWHSCGIFDILNNLNTGGPDASDTFAIGTTEIQFIGIKNALPGTPLPHTDTCVTVVEVIVECPAVNLDISCSDVSAYGAQDGSANADATGCYPPFSYLWNTGETSHSISGLAPGIYSVTVTDSIGTNIIDSCEVGDVPAPITIAGEIFTEDGTPVNEVIVNLMDITGNTLPGDTSNTDGEYVLSVTSGSSVIVTPEKDDNPVDGVSTVDLINIQRHILFIELLDSPYKIIAADINEDGLVSTADLVETQSIILGILPGFININSYRFIPEDYIFTNPTNPFNENWPEDKTYVNISQDSLNEDWIAIKVGDVTGATSGARYISGEVDFLAKVMGNEDGSVDLVIGPGEEFYLSGYQLELKIDQAQAGLVEIDFDRSDLPGINHNHFFFDKDKGLLRTNWWHKVDILLSEEDEFFRLRLNPEVNNPDWSSVLELVTHGSIWESEAYAGNGSQWLRLNLIWKEKFEREEYKLYQNRPNPFSRETIIPFLLPHDMEVTLELTDVEGRLLKTTIIDGVEGLNEWRLSNDQFADGVIFYRIITDQWTASKKMLELR